MPRSLMNYSCRSCAVCRRRKNEMPALPEFQSVRQEQAARVAALAAYEKDQLPKLQTAWEQSAKASSWQPLEVASMISAGGGYHD